MKKNKIHVGRLDKDWTLEVDHFVDLLPSMHKVLSWTPAQHNLSEIEHTFHLST